MDPNWIIALTSAAGLVFGTLFSIYKFVMKVRSDRRVQDASLRAAAQAQAQEALSIAREETNLERGRVLEANKQYQELLARQIVELQEDLDNEQRAREALQRRYEEAISEKRNHRND